MLPTFPHQHSALTDTLHAGHDVTALCESDRANVRIFHIHETVNLPATEPQTVFQSGNTKGRYHLKDLCTDRTITLTIWPWNWTFK